MWQPIAGFMLGMALGVALPWVLLGARRITWSFGLPLRMKAFLSFLTAYATALGGGVLIALVSERFEPWIAGGSVLSGLAIDAIVYRDQTEQEPGKMIRGYALGFGPAFVILAMLGALTPAD